MGRKNLLKSALSGYFAELGRKGGKKSAQVRWANATDEQKRANTAAATAARKAKMAKDGGR
jgi:hypothetical protein